MRSPPKTTLEAITQQLKLSFKDVLIGVGSIARALTFLPRIEKLLVLMMDALSQAKNHNFFYFSQLFFFLMNSFMSLEEKCWLLYSRKFWKWRVLRQTLSGMKQLKEVSLIHDFMRITKEVLHTNNRYPKSAFEVEFKMIRIMMGSVKNLEKITIHVNRDVGKTGPMNFIRVLLSHSNKIHDLPRVCNFEVCFCMIYLIYISHVLGLVFLIE